MSTHTTDVTAGWPGSAPDAAPPTLFSRIDRIDQIGRLEPTPPRELRVALLGYGLVGCAVAELAAAAADRLRDAGVSVRWTGALVRDPGRERSGPVLPLVTSGHALLAEPADVCVEVLGGVEPARTLVLKALGAGVPVVTANKSLMAACGPELRVAARKNQTVLACDAAVLAGVPFLGSLARRPLVSKAQRIAGIVNGTTHFVLSAMERGASFEAALADAQRRGFAEPDSSADIGGRDAAEKLCVLLQLAGCGAVRAVDVPTVGIDTLAASDLGGARELGGTIKPVAFASLASGASGAWVGPAFVRRRHPFASMAGVTNALELTSASGDAVTFSGPGAGPAVTAVTIVDDLVEAVVRARRGVRELLPPDVISVDAVRLPPTGEWFLAVDPAPGTSERQVAERLAAGHVPALRVATFDDRVFALTSCATWPAVQQIVRRLSEAGATVGAFPVLPE